jgi:fucose permease
VGAGAACAGDPIDISSDAGWGDTPLTKPAGASAPAPALASASAPAPGAGALHTEIHVPDALQRDLWIVVVLVGTLLGIYVGCETGFGAFITSYMVVGLGRPEGESQLMTGAYWAAIMVGRFASIFVAMRFKPRDYLGASMAGCCVSAVFLLAFAGSAQAVWFFGCVYGLFMACVFPTAIAYAETVFPVQGKHVTIFVVGSATGEMLLPFIISTLFGGGVDPATGEVVRAKGDGPGPIIVMWIVAVATCLNMITYFALVRRGTALKAAIDAAGARAGDGGARRLGNDGVAPTQQLA